MPFPNDFTAVKEDGKYNLVGEDRESDELLLDEMHDYGITGRNRTTTRRRTFFLISIATLLVANFLWSIMLFVVSLHLNTTGPNLIHSPAREAVFWERVVSNSTVELDPTNVFKGKPRPELDKAWEDNYLQWSQIVVSGDDLKAVDRTSIELTDGTGYLGTLGVFHQLHCLDYIRKYLSPEYYHSTETPERNWQHVDHCVDEIRLSIMCHGDISLITWDWKGTETTPYANFKVAHECHNWDSILEWTKAHQADQSAIVRPG